MSKSRIVPCPAGMNKCVARRVVSEWLGAAEHDGNSGLAWRTAFEVGTSSRYKFTMVEEERG